MTRFVAVFVAVGVAIASAGVARAQGTGSMPLPMGATLSFDRFYIRKDNAYAEFKSPDELHRYFNLAHCTCGQEMAGNEQTFAFDLKLDMMTMAAPVDVYVGTSCNDSQLRPTQCALVDKVDDINSIRTSTVKIEVPTYKAINVNQAGACNTSKKTATVWLMVDLNGDSTYDHWVTTAVAEPANVTPKGIDVEPPPLPTSITAVGSEKSITIEWEPPTSREDDLYYFQALCANVDNTAVGKNPIPEPQYQRPSDVCTSTVITAPTATDLSDPDEMEVSSVPTPFASFDPAFLCGEADRGARSLTVDGLEDGTPYKVALIMIDAYGNFTGTYFTRTVTPKPVIDFWEDLQSRDGAVDGGCLLSTTYGDGNPLTRTLREFRDDTLARSAAGRWLAVAYYATLGKLHVESLAARIAAGIALLPLVAIALAWHLLGLPALLGLLALVILWRRRGLWRRGALSRSRRLRLAAAAAATALVLGLAPGIAAADDFSPYWEDPAQDQAALEAGEVKWHAGIRLGPYTPDIDLQFSQNAVTGKGPYEAMFGDYYVGGEKKEKRVWQVMPMLDVDRIVWRGFGQIGVGGSLGYMQKTAYAYADGSNENQPMRERSTGSKNTFRLFPLAATVTYRFTYADERWGIPVVPYVRAGLSYYMWWIKGPGGTSKVCEGGGDEGEMCTNDKAYGGTPGVQVSAGLAIRAERVDAAAARSMRNSGLQHAGFYGEVFWGRVDGFGSETKLWVGDTTWFAGANFEF